MTALVIGIRYLTGYAVATDPASRERAEWPPHPARLFMALAAAHFETGEDAEEAQALQWLERLPHPILYATEADKPQIVTVYVPVNDKPTGTGTLQSVVGLTRGKQPRTFPRVRPHDETVYLAWPDVQPNAHGPALERLCAKVTRIGHSSSLVHMWFADDLPQDSHGRRWEPHELEAETQLRVVGAGSLEYLQQQYGARAREEYHRMNEQIQALEADKKAARGRGGRQRRLALHQQMDELKAKLPDQPPGDPLRPVMSLWQGYRRAKEPLDEKITGTVWDPSLIVRRLEPLESHHWRLDLASTLQLTAAMHKAVIERASEPVPEFISGHRTDGAPTEQPHLGYLPLAFVGAEHATGHVLGLGIAVPRELDELQRRIALAAVGQVQELVVGHLGKWKLDRDDQGKVNLSIDVWTGGSQGSTHWATVTPIAFDQHPKAKDRIEREKELADMIATACWRVGLPNPLHVILTPISIHMGTPASHEFPRMQRKDGSERRHAHAILVFNKPVRGPIALGAGRYRGYGFCRPLKTGEIV